MTGYPASATIRALPTSQTFGSTNISLESINAWSFSAFIVNAALSMALPHLDQSIKISEIKNSLAD